VSSSLDADVLDGSRRSDPYDAITVNAPHSRRRGSRPTEVDAAAGVERSPRRPVALEQRLLLLVAVHALDHVRRRLLQVARDTPERLVVVDVRAREVLGEEVAPSRAAAARPPGRSGWAPWPSSPAPRSSSRASAGRRGRAPTSSALAPSAAVRTMTPPFFTSICLRISFRRVRSSSSSRRDTRALRRSVRTRRTARVAKSPSSGARPWISSDP